MELIKPGFSYDFMAKRGFFLALSAILFTISIGAFIFIGPKLGTDFKGGTEVEVAFKGEVTAAEVRGAAEKAGFESPEVVAIVDRLPNHFLIRVQEVTVLKEDQKQVVRDKLCLAGDGQATPPEDRCPKNARASEVKFSPGGDKISVRYEETPDLAKIASQLGGIPGIELRAGAKNPQVVSERDHKVDIQLKSRGDQLLDKLHETFGDKAPDQALRVEWIGAKATAQLRDAALKSVVITIFFIMAYVGFRFDMRFAPGTIFSLLHDVVLAGGALVLARREFTVSTVAAMLTVLGYSVNDTIVVFDRIRENLVKHRSMPLPAIINLSVSEMLGRTIITTGVTALSMILFLVWGTGVIKDFAFALLVGMAAGTYSTIYIAAPVTEYIDRRFFNSKSQRERALSKVRAAKRADAVV